MTKLYLELIISIASGLTTFLIAFTILKRMRFKREIRQRVKFITLQNVSPYVTRKFESEIKKLDQQVLIFGDDLIKNKYRNRLGDLTNQAGGDSEKTFSQLVKRKIYLAFIGLFISFILILQGRFVWVLPTLGLTALAFFIPNSYFYVMRLFKGRYGRRLDQIANSSGGNWQSSERVIRAKVLSSLSVFGIAYILILFESKSFSSLWYLPLSLLGGFFIPDVFLLNKVAKRRALFEETLPDSIDLLSMCVNAGLAFSAALAKVAEIQKGPVPEEFARVRAEVQLGKDRSDALREMSDRMKIDVLKNFVNAVGQVDKFGIPISDALKEQSRELRAERKSRGREKAQKVPVKILGPVMICFLPCVLLIVLGPAVIGFIAGS